MVNMRYSYLGKPYSDHDIEIALEKYPDLKYYIPENIVGSTAQYIKDGYIIGWFQGCSEFGPRALGNRSILVDPRKRDMKDILNVQVKFRESFRPFAPAVMWEYQVDYFNLDVLAPFMLLVMDVKNQKREIIPSVTHVDGTARIQSVTSHSNPLFYQLIQAFYKITGVPVLLNTSFNIKGEPIVETPDDALRCFAKTKIDILSIGSYIVTKGKVVM